MILILVLAAALGYTIGTFIFAPAQFIGFFEAIILFILKIIDILLMPLNFLIQTLAPDLNSAMLNIVDYYNYAGELMGWVLSALAIPSTALVLAASYYLFKWTISAAAYGFKLVLSWKRSLG